MLHGLNLVNQIQHLEACKAVVYPQSFFSPKNCYTGEYRINSDTHAIHHFTGSRQHGKNRKDWINRLFYS